MLYPCYHAQKNTVETFGENLLPELAALVTAGSCVLILTVNPMIARTMLTVGEIWRLASFHNITL